MTAITKREFNAIKTLKRFLSAEEFKDFKELINKNVNLIEIEIGNEIRINYYNVNYYYNRKELIYSMQIERTIGFKAKYSLTIRKFDINIIEKYILNNDIALRLIRQLKNNDKIVFDNRLKRLKFERDITRIHEEYNTKYIDTIYFYLDVNRPKFRLMKIKT